MEKALKGLMGLVMAVSIMFVCGFIGGPEIKTSYNDYRVSAGETLWEIADANYMACASGAKICFEEYLYNLKQENIHLFKNGRMLQPGDPLKIPVYTVVK